MKNHISYLLLSSLVCFFINLSPLQSQTAHDKYLTETIYLEPLHYVKNGQKYPYGMFHKFLKKEMEVSPYAVIEYKKFEKNRNIAFVPFILGAGAVASAIMIDTDDDKLKMGLLYSGAGLLAISIPFTFKSQQSLHKAVWLRNRDVLK